MRTFSDLNPITLAVWFLSVAGICMFCNFPVVTGLSLMAAVVFFLVRNKTAHRKTHLFFAVLFLVLALVNPLMSHNGVTVLFVLNHNPVTLEATLYGLNSAVMIVGVLYWFRSMTQIMTSEKLLYLTGALSPKLSLVLSMSLRFVPLFARQSEKIGQSQKALGLYKEDNALDTIRGKLREFSVLITWALENGIITADSMESRGYGIGRRSQFRTFRFTRIDALLTLLTLALTGLCAAAIGTGALTFGFYPALCIERWDSLSIAGILAFAALVLLPTIIELEVNLRWRFLTSRI
ncbi:MAG: cobalt transport protein [Oscillospiraceae bacterium]|nr:cobalt transport protein [Oscillospiraceae bacterium]